MYIYNESDRIFVPKKISICDLLHFTNIAY